MPHVVSSRLVVFFAPRLRQRRGGGKRPAPQGTSSGLPGRRMAAAASSIRPGLRPRPGHATHPAAAEGRMVPFFVQIKCNLGKSYDVATALAESEIASEIYSTAGDYDLLVKFYVEKDTDIGHFVTEKVQTISGIQDTRTIITFKAF
jgi:DNA-binding Lrp family transcriptional regulator